VAAMFDPLPGALLLACAWDQEGLGRAATDALLDGELTPHALQPAAAAALWARARAAAGEGPEAMAIDAALYRRGDPRAAAQAWLAARAAQRAALAAGDAE